MLSFFPRGVLDGILNLIEPVSEMFNVRLAGGHLYGKQLFTWLSLVVSFMAAFVLSFFPLDVLDGIWDLIESVSEGFLTYTFLPTRP